MRKRGSVNIGLLALLALAVVATPALLSLGGSFERVLGGNAASAQVETHVSSGPQASLASAVRRLPKAVRRVPTATKQIPKAAMKLPEAAGHAAHKIPHAVGDAAHKLPDAVDHLLGPKPTAADLAPAQPKRFFPNTRIVADVGFSGGVGVSVGAGIGFVRENDLAKGRNGFFASANANWLAGGSKYKSYRPELTQGPGEFAKNIGFFGFDDPPRGVKTEFSLPSMFALGTGGFLPGAGVANHMGRPGVSVKLAVPITLFPIIGDAAAATIKAAIPDWVPYGDKIRHLVEIGAVRIGFKFSIYHPKLAPIERTVNVFAKRIDPYVQQMNAAALRFRTFSLNVAKYGVTIAAPVIVGAVQLYKAQRNESGPGFGEHRRFLASEAAKLDR